MRSFKEGVKMTVGLVLAFQFNTACSQMTFDEKLDRLYNKTVPLIRPAEIKVESSKDTYFLDTRSPEEYEVSHLPNARLIDYSDFRLEQIQHIPKDAEVVVYCSVGYRSEKIGEELLENGYTNVKNIYGGIFQWKNEGREVLNANNQPTDSVHTYNKNWSKWLTQGIKVYD